MADSTPAVQAELTAALALLDPQIKGLEGLRATGVSSDAGTALDRELTTQNERRALIEAAWGAINALQADGYPDVPMVSVPVSVLAELQEEQAAIAAAIAMFNDNTVTAGPMTFTPNPTPPTKAGP